jgi:hypothetical protein
MKWKQKNRETWLWTAEKNEAAEKDNLIASIVI